VHAQVKKDGIGLVLERERPGLFGYSGVDDFMKVAEAEPYHAAECFVVIHKRAAIFFRMAASGLQILGSPRRYPVCIATLIRTTTLKVTWATTEMAKAIKTRVVESVGCSPAWLWLVISLGLPLLGTPSLSFEVVRNNTLFETSSN
jgi:hypothetical protein